MQQGDHAEAAVRFAESQRLEPAPGTLLNLAIAEEKLGRLSSAWAHARSAVEQLPSSDDRAAVARDVFARLDRRVPRIVLRTKGLPRDARVELDGSELRAGSFGLPIPVDPGPHRVTIAAPGHVDRVLQLAAAEAETVEGDIEVGPVVVVGTKLRDTHVTVGSGSTVRTFGWVSLATGGIAAIAGGVSGALAMDRNGTVEDRCEGRFCDREGAAAAVEGRTFATVSTAMFVGAGVLVAAGVVMLIVSPRSAPTRPMAGLHF